MHRNAGLLTLTFCLVASTCWALYSVSNKGEWPDTWPKELEVLRKDSRTLVGPMLENRHYAIPFTDREQFEKLWPHLLSVKTKEAPLILVKGPNFFLGKEVKAGVVVHSPPKDRTINPAKIGAPISSANYHERLTDITFIELCVDGDIVDLNRIPLPAECLVIDRRFNEPK